MGVGRWAFPNYDRPVPVAHARSAGQQRVFASDVCIGMHGDRGNVQLASKRALVQCLNVFQSMLEPVPAQVDFILGHRIKHERVIRIWGMTQGKDVGVIVRHLFLSPNRLDRIHSVRRNKALGCLAINERRNFGGRSSCDA